MSALDRVLPAARLVELDSVELSIPVDRAWAVLRHGDLGVTGIIRALFAFRTAPSLLLGRRTEAPVLRVDDLRSSAERPGFQVLADEPPGEFVVGAIGKVWQPDIPFVHVVGASQFAAFQEPDFVKVAWAVALRPQGRHETVVTIEVRVTATDDAAWRKFRAYFALIGPPSRFIRRSLLSSLARSFGTPESTLDSLVVPGDALLGADAAQVTQSVVVSATPETIWPWLVQMGCGRGGFYSWDLLDNDRRSAREIHPELQDLRVGQVIPAAPGSDDGFEVLLLDAPRTLVLGGLFDTGLEVQRPFDAPRPPDFWQVTWAFSLVPVDGERTRLVVRARAACSDSQRLHLMAMRFMHRFMEAEQLAGLAARVEGRLPASDYRDVLEGVAGAAMMVAAGLTPFLRNARSHWGLRDELARRSYPGDTLVSAPTWGWTHGIEIDAPVAAVWPWLAQIGSGRGGFYSYQWLENIAGCGIRNAEAVHPEWELRVGEELRLHPRIPAPRVVELERGRYFVAHAAPSGAREPGSPWAAMSWLFLVEPIDDEHCRVVSRYRVASSGEMLSRLAYGPLLMEPIGFAMDRRMLLGIKERAESPA